VTVPGGLLGSAAAEVGRPFPGGRPAGYHARMTTTTPSDRLYFTGDAEADRLLVSEPLALLIGFALDQQVTVQKAFSAPLELRHRIGALDAAEIASIDATRFQEVFRRPPALHRFPASMAGKVQALAAAIARDYDNDAARVWTEAKDGKDLERRLLALPGFGAMKAKALIAIIGLRLGVQPPGWDAVRPTHPTLGDVDSPESLARYQEGKRAYKAALKAKSG
jgi:uncharacterized HhH-GPD family protein